MGQPYEPIIGIGIVKPGEKTDSSGKPIPLIGGMTWGKKCQNRAYKDAMRHVPGMAINGAEVLEDADERDIHVEVPQGAQLTREQAIALVAEAERLSIAPPQPATAEQAAATLAQNNARQRGTGPDWHGFGDDDNDPDLGAIAQQAAANDAAFETLPSASAERTPADRYEGGKAESNGANGKASPGTSHNDRPFKDQGSAVQWACRFPYNRKDDKPDIPHAVGSLKKLCAELGCSDREVDCWADAWMDHVAAKAAATMEPTHAELDAAAAAQS
jgi:hypothetical protein